MNDRAIAETLRRYRIQHSGMTQKQMAQLSGVGEKTIGSYETAARAERIKLTQLVAILKVTGSTLAMFERDVNNWRPPARPALRDGSDFAAEIDALGTEP